MKTKKLTLDRETLASLSPSDLDQVNGGIDWTNIVRPILTRLACPIAPIDLRTRAVPCAGDK